MSEEKQKGTRSEDPNRRDLPQDREEQSTASKGDTVVPAIHHIGPTLESDPNYVQVPNTGYSTPEAQIADQAGRAGVDQRRMEEDDFDPLSGKSLQDRPERLKTRMPGDSSSDPHTDVGPDNATTLQNRSDDAERKHRAK